MWYLVALGALVPVAGWTEWLGQWGGGQDRFSPRLCGQIERALQDSIIGQDDAIRELSDVICDHLSDPDPKRPLAISVHGPPGVGKSLTHLLLARALNDLYVEDTVAAPATCASSSLGLRSPELLQPTRCPGILCPNYQVFYGLDDIELTFEVDIATAETSHHHQGGDDVPPSPSSPSPGPASPRPPSALGLGVPLYSSATHSRVQRNLGALEKIEDHLRRYPLSLIVLEEYDKLDCRERATLRRLLDRGVGYAPSSSSSSSSSSRGQASLSQHHRSIIILESNVGFGLIDGIAAGLHGKWDTSSSGSTTGEQEGPSREAGGEKGDDTHHTNLQQFSITREAFQRELKEEVFEKWTSGARCREEDRQDILRALSLVKFYIPFLPLSRQDLGRVVRKELGTLRRQICGGTFRGVGGERDRPGARGGFWWWTGSRNSNPAHTWTMVGADWPPWLHMDLVWGDEVESFLTERVEYDAETGFAVEGAREVSTMITRHVTGKLRRLLRAQIDALAPPDVEPGSRRMTAIGKLTEHLSTSSNLGVRGLGRAVSSIAHLGRTTRALVMWVRQSLWGGTSANNTSSSSTESGAGVRPTMKMRTGRVELVVKNSKINVRLVMQDDATG